MKALTCTLVAILAMVWPSAAAVALELTSDDVMSVGNPLVTMLDTRNSSAVSLGQEASGAGITATRADGGPFILYESDAAGLYVPSSAGSPDAQQVGLGVVGVGEDPTSVAEPGTLALVALAALGVGGVALTRRRRDPFRPR
jgi:hypothetical protein